MAEPVDSQQGVCPFCKHKLETGATKCPACRQQIKRDEASSVLTEFVRRLEEIDKEFSQKETKGKAIVDRRSRLIADYTVPRDREHLWEFINYVFPRARASEKPDPNMADWAAKFDGLVNAAKDVFKDDRTKRAAIEEMDRQLKAESQQMKKKKGVLFISLLVGIAILIAIGLVYSNKKSEAERQVATKIAEEQKAVDLAKIQADKEKAQAVAQAEKEAELARIQADKEKAQAAKEAELARIQAEKEKAAASRAATEKRKIATEKVW